MHPPFGFALFYLRGIADTLFKEKRIDRPVLSNDIYLGSIPWVIMQLLLVAVVIFIPQTVTVFLDKEVVVDIDKVKIEAPPELPGSPQAADPFATPPAAGASAPEGAGDSEQQKIDDLFKENPPASPGLPSVSDEQKKIDDLFKEKK